MKETIQTAQYVRWGIRFTGIVQGVGFRPLVSIGAHDLGLTGFVYNDSEGVYIEVQGLEDDASFFIELMYYGAPRLCRITSHTVKVLPLVTGETDFVVKVSPASGPVHTFISADTAPCDDCLEEMKKGPVRRIDYPFINCTNCGPRYTLIDHMPYDRERTSMNDFPMCHDCQLEYDTLDNRRYRAEPNACSDCGPSYSMYRADGTLIGPLDVQQVQQWVTAGQIIALKGIGGYHLVCNAYDEEAVRTLRARKDRPVKPLAVMAGSLTAVDNIATYTVEEQQLLESPSRPIVLLESKQTLAPSVAPGQHTIGCMLPYAPVHNVLLPLDAVWVMTSGNRSGDPVLFEDDKAFIALQGIADYFIVHNRRIVAPLDDSVAFVAPQGTRLLRRSRGYVPEPLHSEKIGRSSLLAMGGDMKNTFAISRDHHIIAGPYGGDMGRVSTFEQLEWTIEHFRDLFDFHPEGIVVDSHPGYFSSQLGRELGERWQVPVVDVQHHHSHIASVIGEHNLTGPVLGVSMDGTGYGPDGSMWGGEWLLCERGQYKRMAHLHYAPLPGGEQAVREPWRQALWYLRQYYGDALPPVYTEWLYTLPKGWNMIDSLLASDMPQITSCGAGRLFDAVGALLGLGNHHRFDSQVAMAVEQAAHGCKGYMWEYDFDGHVLDMTRTVRILMDERANGADIGQLAANFHRTLSVAIGEVSNSICERFDVNAVALSGGVFQNKRLLTELSHSWHSDPFYLNQYVPSNDGGLSVGQLVVAHERMNY